MALRFADADEAWKCDALLLTESFVVPDVTFINYFSPDPTTLGRHRRFLAYFPRISLYPLL